MKEIKSYIHESDVLVKQKIIRNVIARNVNEKKTLDFPPRTEKYILLSSYDKNITLNINCQKRSTLKDAACLFYKSKVLTFE